MDFVNNTAAFFENFVFFDIFGAFGMLYWYCIKTVYGIRLKKEEFFYENFKIKENYGGISVGNDGYIGYANYVIGTYACKY